VGGQKPDLIYAVVRATVPSMAIAGKTKRTAAYQHADKNGWEIGRTRSGHLAMRKDGHIVYAPSTPSDWRGEKNALAKLRRCERGQCHCHLRHPSLTA
jgi:hypothetical protein